MKYEHIIVLSFIKAWVSFFFSSDIQQLPLPHSGHHHLWILCDVYCGFSQENLYVCRCGEKNKQIYYLEKQRLMKAGQQEVTDTE